MGLLRAIGGLFSSAGHAIAGLAHAAWQGVKSVFHFAATVFDFVGGAWSWMVNGLGWLGDNLIGGLARLLHLLEWLALHAIPEGLAWVFKKAIGWAKAAIHTLGHELTLALRTVTRFLTGLIRTVEHWAKRAVGLVWHTLAGVFNWVERVGKKVADLVLHPERLAAWLGGHVVIPVIRWALSSSAFIIVWLFKSALRMLPTLAHTLEEALEKLL